MNFEEQQKHNLLVNVARLYYLQRLTHQQIADKLSISRIKVTRLLQEAVENQIVAFHIKDPIIGTSELKERLEKLFHLREAVITPAPADGAAFYDVLGHYAATFLMDNLTDHAVVGMGFGRTLNGMLPYLKRVSCKNIEIVSLTGGLAANQEQPNPYDVVSAVAAKLGGRAHYMLVPAIAESAEAKEIFFRDKTVQPITELWDKLDVCIMSIGLISPETGVFYAFDNPAAQADLTRKSGGVGDLLIRPFDKCGNFIAVDFLERTIAVDFGQIKRAPLVVGVAGGDRKFAAVLGALRSGYLNILITDEVTAVRLVNHPES